MLNREQYALDKINAGLDNINIILSQVTEAKDINEKIRLLRNVQSYASSYADEAEGALTHNNEQIEKYITEIVKYLRRRKIDHNSLAIFTATMQFFNRTKKGWSRENLCWDDTEYMQTEIENRYGIDDKHFYSKNA